MVATAPGFVCASCYTEYDTRPDVCLTCWRSGVVVPMHRRPAAAMIPQTGGMTARALAASDQKVFSCKAYPALTLATNSFIVIAGGPGNGKTTFALRFAESLQPSAFLAVEEGIGPSLGAKLRRLEIRSKDLWIEEPKSVEGILAVADREGLRCLVVDSGTVCSLLPGDWLQLARAKDLILLVTLQVLKSGEHAGSMRWLHDADICMTAENMVFSVTKSRYQEAGFTGEIL